MLLHCKKPGSVKIRVPTPAYGRSGVILAQPCLEQGNDPTLVKDHDGVPNVPCWALLCKDPLDLTFAAAAPFLHAAPLVLLCPYLVMDSW